MSLRVVTWNIAYAHGQGSDGVDYKQKSRAWFQNGLREIANTLRASKADIVCLQEVDLDSARSHHMHQANEIAALADYPHVSILELWNSSYVPFPGLNPFRHWGKIRSGLAVLSQYPITPMESTIFEKPKANSFAYNFFYINRGIQRVSVSHPARDAPLVFGNLHLEAFDPVARSHQMQQIQASVTDGEWDWLVGDWNGKERPQTSDSTSSGPIPTFPSLNPKDSFDGGVFMQKFAEMRSVAALTESPYSDHIGLIFDLELRPQP
jgi:endonuclease/exonuclease/phosphatase family metal-dependent hydrolase